MPEEEGKYRAQMFMGKWTVAKNPDGSCVYLGRGGCTIHATKPHVCKWYDCRKVVGRYGTDAMQRNAVALGTLRAELYEAARKLREVNRVS
jgi:Fe-S-cluster containining protein